MLTPNRSLPVNKGLLLLATGYVATYIMIKTLLFYANVIAPLGELDLMHLIQL